MSVKLDHGDRQERVTIVAYMGIFCSFILIAYANIRF